MGVVIVTTNHIDVPFVVSDCVSSYMLHLRERRFLKYDFVLVIEEVDLGTVD